MINLRNRYHIATIVALVFHLIGIIGIIFFDRELFLKATPYNMMLMFALVLFTQKKISLPFVFFFLICAVTGFGVEMAGINSGLLFGEYSYGNVLGPTYKNVPLLIGLNWFLIIFCCGTAVNILLEKLSVKLSQMTGAPSPAIKLFSIMSDGAILAVFFDWVMEPAAVKLGYWEWLGDGSIPTFNYLCWFLISAALLAVFAVLKFDKRNVFAVNLLLIMMMFFMLIRTFI